MGSTIVPFWDVFKPPSYCHYFSQQKPPKYGNYFFFERCPFANYNNSI